MRTSDDIRQALTDATLRMPDIRLVMRGGSWREIMAKLRSLDDGTLENVITAAFPKYAAEVVLMALKKRDHWLTTPEMNEDKAIRLIMSFAATINCAVTPERIFFTSPGAPRARPVPTALNWNEILAKLIYGSDKMNPGFDCSIANAVVDHVHPENARLARAYFAASFIKGLTVEPIPWKYPFELLCNGMLLEAIYEDGVAQVATRTNVDYIQ